VQTLTQAKLLTLSKANPVYTNNWAPIFTKTTRSQTQIASHRPYRPESPLLTISNPESTPITAASLIIDLPLVSQVEDRPTDGAEDSNYVNHTPESTRNATPQRIICLGCLESNANSLRIGNPRKTSEHHRSR